MRVLIIGGWVDERAGNWHTQEEEKLCAAPEVLIPPSKDVVVGGGWEASVVPKYSSCSWCRLQGNFALSIKTWLE